MPMSARAVAGVISFCMAMAGLVMTNLFLMRMIAEINRKRSAGSPISNVGFTPPKIGRIVREYRQCCPTGRWRTYLFAAYAMTIVCFVAVAVCIGIIG
jgi:hypothetical protein